MRLFQLIDPNYIQSTPHHQWAVLGPDAARFAAKLGLAVPADISLFQAEAVLVVEALSSEEDAAAWLGQLVHTIRNEARLLVVDWQADGPLDVGPALERRFKRGRLCRLLRESGFGLVETLANDSLYYIVRASKGAAAPPAHADEYFEVAALDELPQNFMKPVELMGHKIIVANTGKEIVAFAQSCPHADGRLHEGRLRGQNVVCPVHYYIWNVRSGEPVYPDDEDILRRYPVKIDQSRKKVYIALNNANNRT